MSSCFKASMSYSDCKAALSDQPNEPAVFASPPGLHLEYACTVYAVGCHINGKRPMATSPTNSRRIKDAARKKKSSVENLRIDFRHLVGPSSVSFHVYLDRHPEYRSGSLQIIDARVGDEGLDE
jgi:hypothetical protein